MKANKNVKKSYAYVVDITNCTTAEDVALAFALAKHNADLPLSDNNLTAIVNYSIDEFAKNIYTVISATACANESKEGMFKRFWNWISRKK